MARYSSNIFVPPSFTFLTFVYVALCKVDNAFAFYTIVQGLILGLMLPVFFFLLIKNKGIVSDIDATIKEERIFPYLFGVGLSGAGILINWLLDYNTLVVIWFIYLVTMISLLAINRSWKISAHAMGVSIPMGVLIHFEEVTSMYYIPMILLICWSRIYLKKHTTTQVVAGSFLGLLLSNLIISMI